MSREMRQMIIALTDEALDYEISHSTSYASPFYRAYTAERQERLERAARLARQYAEPR